VEARGRGREGHTPKRDNARRGSAVQSPVNAACTERTQRMRKPLKSDRKETRPGRRRRLVVETARREGSAERRAGYRGGETSESGSPRALPA